MTRVEGLEDRALLTAPVAVDDAFVTNLNTPLNAPSVLANDTDADGDTIDQAFVNSQPSHGTVTMASNGTFTYTPTTGFNGTDTFTYTARDSVHGEDSANVGIVTISVGTAASGAPTANSATHSTPANTPLNATLTGTDPNNDPLIFHTVTTGDHGTLSLNSFNGDFTYTPTAGFVGTDSFTFIVTDGTHDSLPATITINVGSVGSNTAPVANARNVTTPINTTLNGLLTGTDADGDSLTFAGGNTLPAHGDLTLNTNGTFSYTPDNGYSGTDQFTFLVNDGTINSAEATVTISIGTVVNNHAPIASSASASTNVNTTLHGVLAATDSDQDPLTFTVGSVLPAHGALSINLNGTYTYLPNSGYTGTDSFTFIANDGTENSNEATVTITIGAVSNSTPLANSATINTAVNTSFTGFLTGSDADGDPLVFIGGSPPGHGSISLAANGAFTYVPDSGFSGTDSFTFRVNDGTVNSASAIVTINVGSGSNTTPVAHALTINTALNTTFNGSLNGTDADGDSLAYSAGTNGADHGTVTINPNGSFTYQPAAGFTGDDAFSYKVNDGTVNSAEATVTVHVGGANATPVANAQTVSTNIDTAVNGTLTATDADGDPLIFLAGSTVPQHGTVTVNPSGSFVYTPDSGFTGDDTFSFRVNDGTVNSQNAFVTIHVGTTAGNTAPVANPKIVSTEVNTTFGGILTGTDADEDPLTFAQGSMTAQHGTVTINLNGTFSYVPDSGYQGDDIFSFRVNDGTVNSSEAVVIVHVVPSSSNNHAPTVVNGNGSATSDATFDGSLSPLATDINGDALTFIVISQPTNGSLSLSPDGTFAYTPDSGFTGNDAFTFRASDGLVNSNTATFSISVSSTSDLFTLNLSPNSGTIATSKRTASPLDSSAGLTNLNPNANFANAAINVEIISGADRHDRIVILDGTSSNGSVDVRGKRVFFNGSEVARLSGGRRGDALQVSFTSNATAESVGGVLQKIALRTTKNAGRSTRTIQVKVSAGGTTSIGTIDAEVA